MTTRRPNVLFIMCDDHASHAMSCYGSRINRTPHIDRIAESGMRFDNCFCTNSICTPSRASILTGTYNHVNGVTTLKTHLDNRIPTYASIMREDGYRTGVFGKWHLGQGPEHEPRGFDEWCVLPGQGDYHDPVMIDSDGERRNRGYVTDLITDQTIDFIRRTDRDTPFCAMCHHKAPHRHWEPDAKHAHMYEDEEIPYPVTFDDDYAGRVAAEAARMRVDRDMGAKDWKEDPPEGLAPDEFKRWAYQRYIKDYLRCVASVDDNTGRLLDFLQDEGLFDDTIVIYTSDQGFFLGDHGWYDKRFMYEESLRMPFLVSYPAGGIAAGSTCDEILTNVDFAPTFLDYAGIPIPDDFQGRSARPLFEGRVPEDWQRSMYYRYWMHRDRTHDVYAHYGVRTRTHKLIHYYNEGFDLPGTSGGGEDPSDELFDLRDDPHELINRYDDPACRATREELEAELARLQDLVGDEPHVPEATR